MQQSEYLSVLFVCKKPNLIDDEEYRNGNNAINGSNGHFKNGKLDEMEK